MIRRIFLAKNVFMNLLNLLTVFKSFIIFKSSSFS